MDWFGCYKKGWQNEIVPEAFSHPAKFARGLIWRIYAHALEQGYLKSGDWVADPFAGVGLGAADALANGLNWFGNELEQNFVDMGAGCDCAGISKADWVDCFGRWTRFAHKDGRHWCPRCLAEAGLVLEDWEPALPGMEAPTVSYKRNSGKIPYTRPHRYVGNLDLFARHARGGATAVLVQGDSRKLVEVLEGARAEGLISSPPFSQLGCQPASGYGASCSSGGQGVRKEMEGIGVNPNATADWAEGNLGNMPTGEPPQAVIASPPHGIASVGHDAGHPRLDATEDARREVEGSGRRPAYGESAGQLGAMREGDVDAVIASPPHATSEVVQSHGRSWRVELGETEGSWRNVGSRYGDQDGQLAEMEEGDPPQAIISSPPFTDSQQSTDADFVMDSTKVNPTPRRLGDRSYFPAEMESDGQLAALPEGEPAQVDGIVASPPFASTLGKGGETKGFHSYDENEAYNRSKRDYVIPDAEGQLGQMKEGESPAGIVQVDACVSSPPHEGTFKDTGGAITGIDWIKAGRLGRTKSSAKRIAPGTTEGYSYSDSPDNIGNTTGDTFWSAAKTILLQCRAVLAPGGVAIWVLKAFVRNKAIVDFPGQWEALCNSCGFETIEVIRAWLVEDRGAQFALDGGLVEKKVARKSFFRRLHEKKYPGLAIDYEIVLITRKGESC